MNNLFKRKKLIKKISIRLFLLLILLILILFIPAGSLHFWQGWLFLAVMFLPMTFTILYFIKYDPELLERRLKTKETAAEQKLIVKIGYAFFPLFFILPGLDFRFGWSDVPTYIVIVGNFLFLISYIIIILVFKENSYASRVVEVDKNQSVISTGPYSVVRHPMYSAVILMYSALPLALGSYLTLLVSLFLPLFFIKRILSEEKILTENLNGYKEYCLKIRYRIVPHVW